MRFLTQLLRDKELGPRAVPILVDEARTFGMEGLFRQIGIYNPAGPELHAGRPRPGHVLPRGQGRPDAAGRHQRARRHEQLDRRGDVVLDEQPHHGAVLRLLLDVRLPARRRPRLGGRRHAGARLPARRHLGPHDAERRGPAARGRPQPHPGRHDPELHQLRPDLRARGRRDPAPRPGAHGREAGQRLLLPDAAERELPAAGAACRHRGGDHQGHVPAAGRREEGAARQPARQRHDPARERSPRASCWSSDWGIAANVWSCPSFNELARDGQAVERWNLLHPTEQPRVAVRRRSSSRSSAAR